MFPEDSRPLCSSIHKGLMCSEADLLGGSPGQRDSRQFGPSWAGDRSGADPVSPGQVIRWGDSGTCGLVSERLRAMSAMLWAWIATVRGVPGDRLTTARTCFSA